MGMKRSNRMQSLKQTKGNCMTTSLVPSDYFCDQKGQSFQILNDTEPKSNIAHSNYRRMIKSFFFVHIADENTLLQ